MRGAAIGGTPPAQCLLVLATAAFCGCSGGRAGSTTAASSGSGGTTSSSASSTTGSDASGASSSASSGSITSSTSAGQSSSSGGLSAISSSSGSGSSVASLSSSSSSSGVPTGPLQLAIVGNRADVLTAIASVEWSYGVTSVHIALTDAVGLDAGSTPDFATDPNVNPQTVPVLGLRDETEYSATAVGTLFDGGALLSNTESFITGPLPTGMPTFRVDAGAAGGPLTLVANVPSHPTLRGEYLTVVDPQGKPVWYLTLPAARGNVGDFEQQPDGTYTVAVFDPEDPIPGSDQEPALFYQFNSLGGVVHIWDSPPVVGDLQVLATDDHEFRLLPDGSGMLIGIVLGHQDLSQTFDGGQPDAGVYGSLIERLAPDGGVMFVWSSFDIPITDMDPGLVASGAASTKLVDAYHANAIDVTSDGNYLVSLRNLSEVVKVDSTTGAILWTLGGIHSDFTFLNDPLGGFSLQHGARELPDGDIILFDDGNYHVPPVSRAAEYALDLTAHTAILVWQAEANPPLSAFALGYAQRLANGNTVVAYGTAKQVQEIGPDGGLLWQLVDPSTDLGIYRAYRIDSLY